MWSLVPWKMCTRAPLFVANHFVVTCCCCCWRRSCADDDEEVEEVEDEGGGLPNYNLQYLCFITFRSSRISRFFLWRNFCALWGWIIISAGWWVVNRRSSTYHTQDAHSLLLCTVPTYCELNTMVVHGGGLSYLAIQHLLVHTSRSLNSFFSSASVS